VRNAGDLVKTDIALVMNGDSYTNVDLSSCVAAHQKSNADLTLVVVPADGRGDIGSVLVDEDGLLKQFVEKKPGITRANHVNAGIYIISSRVLQEIPAGIQISLESELFPRWLEAKKDIRVIVHDGSCVDIGTPERYTIAQQKLACAEVDLDPSQIVEAR
jgi:mannose-1-phosphate guanylyltransferase